MNVSNFVPRNKEVLSGTLLRADYLERRCLCNSEGLHNDKWQWEHVSGSDTVCVEPVLVSICMTYCRPDLWHAHCQCMCIHELDNSALSLPGTTQSGSAQSRGCVCVDILLSHSLSQNRYKHQWWSHFYCWSNDISHFNVLTNVRKHFGKAHGQFESAWFGDNPQQQF